MVHRVRVQADQSRKGEIRETRSSEFVLSGVTSITSVRLEI